MCVCVCVCVFVCVCAKQEMHRGRYKLPGQLQLSFPGTPPPDLSLLSRRSDPYVRLTNLITWYCDQPRLMWPAPMCDRGTQSPYDISNVPLGQSWDKRSICRTKLNSQVRQNWRARYIVSQWGIVYVHHREEKCFGFNIPDGKRFPGQVLSRQG